MSAPITLDDEVSSHEEAATQSSKKARKFSEWGRYFDELELGPDKKRHARCKRCLTTYICEGRYGTQDLKAHALSCSKINRLDKSQLPFSKSLSGSSLSMRSCKVDEDAFREAMTRAIVKHDYPFQIVEHDGLREVFMILNPEYKGITKNTAKADVLNLYRKEKNTLLEVLQTVGGRISITADMWTSITTDVYISLTAHYVDKYWKLKKKLLCFRKLPPDHTGVALAEALSKLVSEWSIESKLFSITLDNVSANDVLVDVYKRQLLLKRVLLFGGQFFHIRCAAHILNLIVQDGLKEVDSIVMKIRETMKYIKGSQVRKEKLRKCMEQLNLNVKMGLRQDVATRWNSTFLMIESALAYRHALQRLSLLDMNYKCCPSADEWNKLEKLYKFLKVFYDCTKTFSGTLYPTSNVFFHGIWMIRWRLNEEMNNVNSFMRRMVQKMKDKFDKYWNDFNLIFVIAVVFDPRYKMGLVEFAFRKIYGEEAIEYVEDVRRKIFSLFEEYATHSDATVQASTSTSFAQSSKSNNGYDDDPLRDFDLFMASASTLQVRKSELDIYLGEPLIDRKQEINILGWWQYNEFRFPKLSKMVRDILAIPISIVASEATFSVGGRVLDERRSSLVAKNVEAIMCTRDWLFEKNDLYKVDEEELEIDISCCMPRDSNEVED